MYTSDISFRIKGAVNPHRRKVPDQSVQSHKSISYSNNVVVQLIESGSFLDECNIDLAFVIPLPFVDSPTAISRDQLIIGYLAKQ